MPLIAKQLTALEVSRLQLPGHYAVGGVPGLYLYVNDGDGRSWILRVVVGSKRRHVGLGGYPAVTLAGARDKARKVREDIENGVDPIERRREAIARLQASHATEKTFEEAANAYISTHQDSWKNAKHRAQWNSTLQTYAYPVIGRLLVRDITQAHILQALEPIWREKNETAVRLRGRIESILDWSTVRGYREGSNPAQWKGRLDKLLLAPSKIRTVAHQRAVPFLEMPKFMTDLRSQPGIAAKALEFAALTAARSGEVRYASWTEIDLETAVWTIPAERMKAGREHRVPLSSACLDLLAMLPPQSEGSLLFEAPRGGALSDMSMTAVMRRMGVNAVPHGLRSTFRDWIFDCTEYPRELAEQALAHVLESKVEAAYRRGDALARRREVMNAWANFCGTQQQVMHKDERELI